VLLYLLGGLVLLAGAAFAYLSVRRPEAAPPSAIRIERTPERLARGKYLATLADCAGCHSPHDMTRFGLPVVEGQLLAGFVFRPENGVPGYVTAPNITPDPETGIGAWTDGEKIRAIREGIDKDGNALFPMMPYTRFRNLSDEDVYALVAYLDSVPPVKSAHPKTKLNFPVGLMIKSEPRPVSAPVPPPLRSNPVTYGKYLAAAGGCQDCHGENLAAGNVFPFPPLQVIAANISPDRQTGIGKWTEKDFLDKFASYRDYVASGPPKAGPDSFTVMPWLSFAQLPDDDLRALYAYLRTLPPVKKAIETHPGFPGRKKT
jgi:cytochrome c553